MQELLQSAAGSASVYICQREPLILAAIPLCRLLCADAQWSSAPLEAKCSATVWEHEAAHAEAYQA